MSNEEKNRCRAQGPGHETRWRMVELLLGHSLCVGALARTLGVTESAASQHLRILRRAGLVRGKSGATGPTIWSRADGWPQ